MNMDKDWLVRWLDSRSQERYSNKGDLKDTVLQSHFDGMSDLSDQTVPTVEKQPALGLFDADTLERVQKSFPYPSFKPSARRS